jgi:methionine aminotransferase
MIILNSPHNPTGSVITTRDLDALALLVKNKPIYILSDEVYEHMVFDQRSHLSLLQHEELRQRSFVVSSFGKTYHATGWKIAYCIAPSRLSIEFRKIHQFVTFTSHTPTQWALAEYMQNCPEHYLNLSDFYQQKRDLFVHLLEDSGFKLTPSRGTYFQLADYSAISDLTDTDFVTYLTQEIGVAAIPISVFYKDPPVQQMIRFCFAKDEQTLQLACEKLKSINPS